ncbi:DUF4344 domain-containing metallopeptidase [Photobacterium aphoticum]|uniref:Metallopeptidase DUF4344 n=1 Tax=Photobacterium aphoticum TaxID=754436 RepID=A0A0J1JK63_9GAMM|nr:DUF4344 domain-containing metallopeptidase [Photobacterium aphoticum]KLV02487.1 hypothetical protein ABT58_02960 [Photobacterium aphoticum]PSU56946.1 hypothetical protein C9I90_11350 [Photobacterium aphoticum]GHA64754.1 hypothetical protein GCM10007086_43060 [Photobacterium aphoticum]
MKHACLSLALLISAGLTQGQVLANDNIRIHYSAAQSEAEQQAAHIIKQSDVNDTVIALSRAHFPFNEPLTITYGSKDGPLYDPDTHQVQIPYGFYLESVNYFANNDYQKRYGKSAQEGALDTLLHTLLHEAGHAYIADQDIPVLGKEEDAVDNFATLLLLDYVDKGDEVAISAADMFAFESDDRPDYYDYGEYIDEHSFDLQRYFSTLCLVYGSDPEAHKALLDEVEEDYLRDRQDFCQYNYESLKTNWQRYWQTPPSDNPSR